MSNSHMLAPDIFAFTAPQTFLGLEVGTRMTVIRTRGDLLLYSPISGLPNMLPLLGTPRWVLAPSRMHHLYVGEWMDRGLEGWAAPGLPEKRPDVTFDHVIREQCAPFGDDVLLIPLRCFSLTNEVVMLHRPSRTLVVTDLVFHFTTDAPGLTRAAMACSLAYPGCRASMLERVAMKRDIARQEIAALLELDFNRLVMAHGAVIESGGKEALRSAYGWLGL
ncbi:MAG: hypothetical protein ACJAZO_001415 [Myxococcota bacterium]|jgi:hypothetical protein